MKKFVTSLFVLATVFIHAQFEENFENGVPGKMTQKFISKETSWIDFGIGAIGIEKPINGSNSAIFFNGLATSETSTSLETPLLDLSSSDMILEFLYFQKKIINGIDNSLSIEISNDNGKIWKQIRLLKSNNELQKVSIPLTEYSNTKNAIIRFISTQYKTDSANPIALDNIKIYKSTNSPSNILNKKNTSIYPNPSNGNFIIKAKEDNYYFELSDMIGHKIFYNKSTVNTTNVNLNNLAKGVYFLNIYFQNNIETHKIIIN